MDQHQSTAVQNNMFHVVNLKLKKEEGAQSKAAIQTGTYGFWITEIRHRIFFDGGSDPTSPSNDGLYRIDFHTASEKRRYWNGMPPLAGLAYGTTKNDRWKKLDKAIWVDSSNTLTVELSNAITRPHDVMIEVQFHGVEILTEKKLTR